MPNPDLSEFEEFSRKRTQCIVARRIEALEPDERAKVEAALDAFDRVSSNAIRKWFLKYHDIRIDDQGIKKHREGECCCV